MIEQDTTVADDGVALFIDVFKEKPRLEALARSFLDPCQELENVLWDVLLGRLIDNATHSQLDTLGKLVGQPRLGYDDETYRLYIRSRALVNRSRAISADIIAVLVPILGEGAFSFQDLYPASFAINTETPLTAGLVAQAQVIASLIAGARAAGVGSSFHFTDEADAGIFLTSATDTQDIDSPHGFSEDAGTIGGTLIGSF